MTSESIAIFTKTEQPRVFLGFVERSWIFPDSVQSKKSELRADKNKHDDFTMSHRHGCDSCQPQSSASCLSSTSNHQSTNFEFWLFLEITSF